MNKLIMLLGMLTLLSCGKGLNSKKSDLIVFNSSLSDFQSYINDQNAPHSTPDMATVKTIRNDDYPIEIALFKDGKWFYYLKNLGDGQGTWNYHEGSLRLFAKRAIFDMEIFVKATRENGQELILEFSDRFGPKILPVKAD